MQDVHLLCSCEKLLALVDALTEQFAAQSEEVTVLDWGSSYKQVNGYIVVEWTDEVDEGFIGQLCADPDILDFSVFSVPCVADEYPFGYELPQL